MINEGIPIIGVLILLLALTVTLTLVYFVLVNKYRTKGVIAYATVSYTTIILMSIFLI